MSAGIAPGSCIVDDFSVCTRHVSCIIDWASRLASQVPRNSDSATAQGGSYDLLLQAAGTKAVLQFTAGHYNETVRMYHELGGSLEGIMCAEEIKHAAAASSQTRHASAQGTSAAGRTAASAQTQHASAQGMSAAGSTAASAETRHAP